MNIFYSLIFCVISTKLFSSESNFKQIVKENTVNGSLFSKVFFHNMKRDFPTKNVKSVFSSVFFYSALGTGLLLFYSKKKNKIGFFTKKVLQAPVEICLRPFKNKNIAKNIFLQVSGIFSLIYFPGLLLTNFQSIKNDFKKEKEKYIEMHKQDEFEDEELSAKMQHDKSEDDGGDYMDFIRQKYQSKNDVEEIEMSQEYKSEDDECKIAKLQKENQEPSEEYKKYLEEYKECSQGAESTFSDEITLFKEMIYEINDIFSIKNEIPVQKGEKVAKNNISFDKFYKLIIGEKSKVLNCFEDEYKTKLLFFYEAISCFISLNTQNTKNIEIAPDSQEYGIKDTNKNYNKVSLKEWGNILKRIKKLFASESPFYQNYYVDFNTQLDKLINNIEEGTIFNKYEFILSIKSIKEKMNILIGTELDSSSSIFYSMCNFVYDNRKKSVKEAPVFSGKGVKIG